RSSTLCVLFVFLSVWGPPRPTLFPYTTLFRSNDLLYIGKYPGNANDPLQNDIQIFRHAEMLLLKAEYLVMNGQWSEVEGVIKELRDARSRTQEAKSMPIITDEQSAWKAILDERRVEFAFEGHRYLDVK